MKRRVNGLVSTQENRGLIIPISVILAVFSTSHHCPFSKRRQQRTAHKRNEWPYEKHVGNNQSGIRQIQSRVRIGFHPA